MIPTTSSPSVTRIEPTFLSTIFLIASKTVDEASILRTSVPFPRRISETRLIPDFNRRAPIVSSLESNGADQPGRRCALPGAVLGRIPRSPAQPADDGLPGNRRDSDSDRRGDRRGSHAELRRSRARRDDRDRRRRNYHFGAAPADRVPAEVPALVVRLEPRTAQVLEPRRCLPRPDGRSLPVDR